MSEKGDGADALLRLGEVASSNIGRFFTTIVNLAQTNPLWGGVLAIIINDVLSHKVNWLTWEHQDLVCTDTPGSIAHNPNGTITGMIISPFQASTTCLQHDKKWVWTPGILSTGAVAQISALILSSFAIAGAGAIIADFTQITKLIGGGTPDPAALVKPSVLTLVNGGVPVTVPGSNVYTQGTSTG